jgi:hypothetical protein
VLQQTFEVGGKVVIIVAAGVIRIELTTIIETIELVVVVGPQDRILKAHKWNQTLLLRLLHSWVNLVSAGLNVRPCAAMGTSIVDVADCGHSVMLKNPCEGRAVPLFKDEATRSCHCATCHGWYPSSLHGEDSYCFPRS